MEGSAGKPFSNSSFIFHRFFWRGRELEAKKGVSGVFTFCNSTSFRKEMDEGSVGCSLSSVSGVARGEVEIK